MRLYIVVTAFSIPCLGLWTPSEKEKNPAIAITSPPEEMRGGSKHSGHSAPKCKHRKARKP